MASQLINGKVQCRHDTAANWMSKTPILLAGEMGVETDTAKFKFGDGTTAWASLAYAGTTAEAPVAVATANRVLRLNGDAKLPADITGTAQNADKAGGLQIGLNTTSGVASIPVINTDGVMEVGWGIDLHDTGSISDYDLRLSVDSFASNKNSNGYQKLPSGLIIQWGWVDQSGQKWSKFINFPIAFPNQCLQVIQTPNPSWDGTTFKTAYTTIQDWSSTGYTIWLSDSGGNRFIAIGY